MEVAVVVQALVETAFAKTVVKESPTSGEILASRKNAPSAGAL